MKWISKFKLPEAKVHSLDDYFALPKEQREKFGLYLKPYALPCDLFRGKGQKGSWGEFSIRIRQLYPVQGFFREWFFDYDNPAYAAVSRFFRRLRDARYAIKRFFKPACPRFRKVFPRHVWMDVHYVIEEANFALLLDFWYEEVVDGWVDWHSDEKHQEVYTFLEKSVNWLEKAKPEIQKLIEAEHEKIRASYENDQKLSYEQKYGEINRLKKLIEDTETEILKKLVEYRGYLWT